MNTFKIIKPLLIIIACSCFVMAGSCVYASEINDANNFTGICDADSDILEISASQIDDEKLVENDMGTFNELDSDSISLGDNVSVNKVIPPGTFADLQRKIFDADYGSVLDLDMDYSAWGCACTMQLHKDLTIDGHGHTLDCEGICSAFYSYKGDIVLKNLRIINGVSQENGGAVYLDGDSDRCPYFENCTFINNYAANDGGAIANYQQRLYSVIDLNTKYYPISIKNCTFINNKAGHDGGAIYGYGTTIIRNSLFDSNFAVNDGGAAFDFFRMQIYDSVFHGNVAKEGCAGAVLGSALDLISCSFSQNTAKEYGGAVNGGIVEFFNSTFNENSAGEYGGAISAQNLLNTYDVNSSFINNSACEESGGAIYSGSVNIKNVLLSGNSANVDGGAIYATSSVIVKNCSFESNNADGAKFSQCYGGAILSENEVFATDCKFRKNHAYDYGGAIYADSITLWGSSCFEDNAAYDNHGGAVYTNKFLGDVTDAVFTGNVAGEDGGAIYINKENGVIFSHCVFENNHCGDEGGAIYLDSSSSHLTLINNVFKGNKAGNEGQCVFNCGHYDRIYDNFWGGKNPSSCNDQLIEWKCFLWSNIPHSDSMPTDFDFRLLDDLKLDTDLIKHYDHRLPGVIENDDADFSMSARYNAGTGYSWIVSPDSYGVDLVSTYDVIDYPDHAGSSGTTYFNFNINSDDFYVKLVLISISGEIVDEIDSNM